MWSGESKFVFHTHFTVHLALNLWFNHIKNDKVQGKGKSLLEALKVAGGWGSQIYRQSAHDDQPNSFLLGLSRPQGPKD